MSLDSKKAERDKRLDELQTAVLKWAASEKKRLSDEVTFLKSVLQGRTGSGRLSDSGVSDTTKIFVDSVGEFLEG